MRAVAVASLLTHLAVCAEAGCSDDSCAQPLKDHALLQGHVVNKKLFSMGDGAANSTESPLKVQFKLAYAGCFCKPPLKQLINRGGGNHRMTPSQCASLVAKHRADGNAYGCVNEFVVTNTKFSPIPICMCRVNLNSLPCICNPARQGKADLYEITEVSDADSDVEAVPFRMLRQRSYCGGGGNKGIRASTVQECANKVHNDGDCTATFSAKPGFCLCLKVGETCDRRWFGASHPDPVVIYEITAKNKPVGEVAAKEPALKEPATQKPAAEKPAAEAPAAKEPATKDPATKEPATKSDDSTNAAAGTSYEVGADGKNGQESCPAGYAPILTEDVCRAAAEVLSRRFIKAETNVAKPKGCFRTNKGKLRFNKHAVGAGRSDLAPVCSKASLE